MIPDFNMAGVLPPIRPGQDGISPDRSPYPVALHAVVDRFAKTPERIAILQGLLDYRAALHGIGVNSGFQWLDGSFMEQVEVLESRPPNDVDAVTFFYLPQGVDQRTLATQHGALFTPKDIKENFNVDGYPVTLGTHMTPYHIKNISYWYSMWSHRRDGLWKGFIQVDLSPTEDVAARAALALIQQQGGGTV
jgi:hypothetical protein